MIRRWKIRRAWRRQYTLANLVRAAMEQPYDSRHPAGPTTDPATIAGRLLESGRVKVK